MNWFGRKNISPFEAFEWYHIIMIIIYIIGMSILLIYSNKLNSERSGLIRIGLLIILVISELSYQAWGLANGTWNATEHLPFQLCSIAGVLAMLALYTRYSKLIQIVFFIGIVPPFLAVITPELYYGFPHFRFWQFFIHHITLSWASLFLILSNPIKITLNRTLEAYLYLLCYAVVVGFVINPILDANFLFLARTPSANTPLNLLGNGVWYYVNLCLLGLFVFITIFSVHRLVISKRNTNNFNN